LKREFSGKWDVTIIGAKDGKVIRCGVDQGVVWSEPCSIPDAAGSGSRFAFTAMDMGATAKQAIQMAMKRDTGTGGKIHVFKVR
jgi:hypothetical protein